MARNSFHVFVGTLIDDDVIVVIGFGLVRLLRAVSTLNTLRKVTSDHLREISSREARDIPYLPILSGRMQYPQAELYLRFSRAGQPHQVLRRNPGHNSSDFIHSIVEGLFSPQSCHGCRHLR